MFTRFVNIEKEGLHPDEWYDYNTLAILVEATGYGVHGTQAGIGHLPEAAARAVAAAVRDRKVFIGVLTMSNVKQVSRSGTG